jgi:phenylpyruvate tautomerase PptA (4-oxalocrotonate tautomerase family)
MPFIDSKITVKMNDEQKTELKSRLGQAISTMNKTESYLMVGICDGYDLYFGGNKLDKGAYVEVSVFGDVKPAASDAMTGKICEILGDVLSIPGDAVYVTYHGVHDWGWNNSNF